MVSWAFSRKPRTFFSGLYTGCCESELLRPCPDFISSDSGAYEYCYKNLDAYNAGVDSGKATQKHYCRLGSLESTCPSSPGQLQINAFLRENARLLDKAILPSGIALAVLGVLLLLPFLASAEMLCCSCEAKGPTIPLQQRAMGSAPWGTSSYQIQYV